MGGTEIKYIQKAFSQNWIAPLGPNVDGFEGDLLSFTETKACVSLNTGTGAIHLALILLGVEAGDTVLCPSFTFSASCNPICYLGAKPVFVDSEKKTWNMSPELLEDAIKSCLKKGNKPKAIIFVHLYGMPAKIDEIIEIADKYKIPMIEDAAEALGSKYKGKSVGTFGKFGIFSFNGNKIITTSGGGVLISDDCELIEQARFLATQARDDASHYQHSQIGYNYRMSNVLAGIGRGQMEVLSQRVREKREINRWYKKLFAEVEGVNFLTEPNKDFYSNHWLTAITIDERLAGFSREKLRLAFEKGNIESRPLWKPMHLQPVFAQYPAFIDGTSENLFKKGLCLPSGTSMSDDDRDRISKVISRFI